MMKGFDPEFADVPDFCDKITHRIWEGRGLDRIREYYHPTGPVRTALSFTESNEDVILNTTEALYTFPDRKLLDEDFINSEDEPGVFYSSHRVLSVMTHQAGGVYGEPTGREIRVRAVADCIYIGNQVTDEWLARDQAGLLKQIGIDPEEYARKLASEDLAAGKAAPSSEELLERWGGGPQANPISAITETYANSLSEILSLAKIRNYGLLYDQACTIYGPGAIDYCGHEQASKFAMGYLASFPKPKFHLYHWIGMEEPGKPVRVSLRWALEAVHRGHGHFGTPTGGPVIVMGITNAEIWGDKVMREFHVIDEVAVRKQIAFHRLANEGVT